MAFSFLNEDNLTKNYKNSKAFTDSLTDSFPELERIARNKPHPSVPKNMPKVTDGTTAAIIRKTPRRVVQQLPTGNVISDQGGWLPIVAGFILQHKIIPYANQDYALISKCWAIIERNLTYGSCPIYTPFLNHHGYFCPDMTLPHWGDVFIQPGKKSDTDSNYIFMRSWWNTEDIDSLIDQETKLSKSAKDRGESYDSSWDLSALEDIKKEITEKEDKAKSANEKEKAPSNTSGVELINAFQRGIGSKFYMFHYRTEKVVRRKINKDPRGEIPLIFGYGDIDGSNPLGRGIIELVGPLQNLMDSEMQMYQYNRALMLNPPIIKRGVYPKRNIKFIPNQIIDVGSNPQSDARPLDISTTAIERFPDNYGLMKSQALNLLSSPDTSISATVGNPGFSKTPAGVDTQNANVSVDDNQVRKMFESVFERWCEGAVNMYFAERTGVDELQLDQETADKLRKLEAEGEIEPGFVSDDNKIRIDYDTATPALKFVVDASSSKMKDDAKQLQGLELLQQSLDTSQVLAGIVPPEKVLALWNSLVNVSSVENPEDLRVDINDFKKKQEQAMAQPQAQAPGLPPMNPNPSADMSAPPATPAEPSPVPVSQGAAISSPVPEALQEPNQPSIHTPEVTPNHPEDQKMMELLTQMGVGRDKINQALIMMHAGKSSGAIMSMLKG